MQKKLFFIIISALLITTLPGNTFAQTGSSIPSSKTLDEIKDKVASRVAELNLVTKKGVVGKVESATDTQLILSTLSGKKRIVDVDEFTDFSGISDSAGISDVEKDSYISVLGLYNKDSERLLARYIDELSIPVSVFGVITEVDEDGFTITLATKENKNYIVDVEKITKTFKFDKSGLITSGFSDLNTLQNIYLIGFEDPDEKERLTASKIIFFPGIPSNPKIKVDVKKQASHSSKKATEN